MSRTVSLSTLLASVSSPDAFFNEDVTDPNGFNIFDLNTSFHNASGSFVGHAPTDNIFVAPGQAGSILFQFNTEAFDEFQMTGASSGSISSFFTVASNSLPPQISFDHLTNSGNEGGLITYTLTRSFVPVGDIGSSVHVHFSGSPTLTALPGVNYIESLTALQGTNLVDNGGDDWTLTFAAGAKTAAFTVKTIDDHVIPAANPNFELFLDNPTNATLGTGTIDTTILNIDKASVTGATTSPPSGGSVHAGQQVTIHLTFSNGVVVTGAPTLKLSDGGVATYDSGNSTSTDLVFNYVAQAGQNTTDLKVTSITLPTGSLIKDAAGSAANLAGAANLDLHLAVDTVAPAVKESLKADTGSSATDKITSDPTLTGSGDPNATVHFKVDGNPIVDSATANSTGVWTLTPTGLADGSHTIIASETDAAGNTGTASLTFTLDTTAPAVGGYSTQSPSNDIGTGGAVTITLNTGEALAVKGVPTLLLTDGESATFSATSSKLASGLMAFTYKAAVGHNGEMVIDHLVLPVGASVTDLAGNTANFSAANGHDLGLNIDTVAPTITAAAINNPPANAALPLGGSIEIDLTASEALNIVGKPTLALSDKGVANYDAGKSDLANGKIAFDYTAAAGQNTTDLKVTSLTLPTGASIKDLAGNPIVVTGAANKDLAIAVDTNAPTVSAVALVLPQPGVSALKSGDDLIIKLTLKDATVGDTLTVTGTPALTLNDGGSAIYDAADSSGNVLAFKYTVGSESTTDLKINGFDFTNGSIRDTAGNSAAMAAALADLKLTANVFTWAHGVSGDWNTGSNWTPNGVPGANNTALITTAGTYTVSSAQANSVGLLNMATTTTLAITGNEFDVTAGTAAGALAGKITIADATTLGLGTTAKATTFNNTGTVGLNSSGDNTDLIIAGNMTLLGAGKVTLSDNANNKIVSDGSAATLTNGNATAGNTISGAGTIGDSHLTLSNQAKGIINGNGTSDALTIHTGTNAISNLGILEGTTAQGLIIKSNVTNSNLIQALGTNARVDLLGTTVTDNTAAATILASGTGAHVDLDGATIAGGTLKFSGTGTAINVIGASTFDGSGVGAPVNNTAIVNVQNGDSLTLKGTFNNTGTVGLNSTGAETDLTISGAVAFTGAGKITLMGADAELISNGSAATLTNGNATAGNTISGVGTLGDHDFLNFTNAAKGIVNASDAAGGTLAIDTKSFTNAGLLEATGHGVLELEADITNTATGQVKAAAAGAHINLDNATITGGTVSTIAGSFLDSVGGSSTISTATTIANAGRLGAEGGNLTISGPVNNTGTLDANNAHLTLQGAVTGTGKATIEGTGSIEFGAASATTGVTFANGATGELILDHSMTYKGTITGFTGPHNAFSSFLGFGDSTLDSGFFPTALANNLTADETGSGPKNALIAAAVAAGGTGTPVGVGLMHSQILANDFGLSALPSDTPGGAGTNFAIAGATDAPNLGSGSDPGNGGVGNLNKNSSLASTVTQINGYLAAHSDTADANALYVISSGGNDITYAKDSIVGTTAQHAYLTDQATALATAIKALETAGAQHVLLDNNYGSGGLSNFYNSAVATALASAGATVITANIQGVVATIVANPTLFGFTANTVQVGDATLTAATQHSAFQPQLTPAFTPSGWAQWGANTTTPSANFASLRAPNAQFTSLFSDNQHLSTIGQIIEANYEFTQLANAGLLPALESIDLRDIAYNSPTSGVIPTIAKFSGTATGGTLTVTDNLGHTANLTLSGDYRSVSFITADDGHGGTLVFDPPASSSATAAVADNPLSSGHYNGAITTGTNLGMTDFTISKDVTLTGDGTITLASSETIISDGHNHTLTIAKETISGGGIIGDDALQLINSAHGVIDANSTNDGMLISTPGHTVSNAGTIEASDGGWLMVDHTTIANNKSGVVQALDAGTRFDLDGGTISGGQVNVGAGATLETINDDASTINAKLDNSGTVAATAGDLTINGSVTNSGVLSVANGNHLVINGAISGSGGATIASGGTLQVDAASNANVTFLDGTGTLVLDQPANDTFKFASTVTGFQHGAGIELVAIDYTTGLAQLTFVENAAHTAGVLTVTDGLHSDALAFVGNYTPNDFVVEQNNTSHHVDILHI